MFSITKCGLHFLSPMRYLLCAWFRLYDFQEHQCLLGFLVMLNKEVKYYPTFYKTLHYFFLFSISPTTDMARVAGVLPAYVSYSANPHFSFTLLSGPDTLQYLKGKWIATGLRSCQGGKKKKPSSSLLAILLHVSPSHFFIWGPSSFGNVFGDCVCCEYELFLRFWCFVFFYFQLFKNRVERGNLHLTKKSQTQTFHI